MHYHAGNGPSRIRTAISVSARKDKPSVNNNRGPSFAVSYSAIGPHLPRRPFNLERADSPVQGIMLSNKRDELWYFVTTNVTEHLYILQWYAWPSMANIQYLVTHPFLLVSSPCKPYIWQLTSTPPGRIFRTEPAILAAAKSGRACFVLFL